MNGGFESPDITTGYALLPSAGTGWTTTDSLNQIEIWSDGFQGVPAYEGGQFGEINANSPGTLSQTLDTSSVQGQDLTWSFAHRGRGGTDVMALLIGAPGNLVEVGRFSASTAGWMLNQGTYTVPAGQTQTVFAYRAISTGSGLPQVGNFIDAVSFGVPPCDPAITLDKSSNYLPGDSLVLDDEITYTFEVENTGNIDLTNVRVDDDMTGLSAITPEVVADLPVGETASFTATYTITQADVDAGVVQNTASATADPPAGFTGPPPTSTDTEQVPPDQVPGLSIVKSSDAEDGVVLAVGDTLTYTFEVENTGNVTLTDVTISDSLAGLEWQTGPVLGELVPGATATGEATYVVTQADIDRGIISNSATATGTPPSGCVDCEDPVSPPSQEDVTLLQEPGLSIVKTADPTTPVDEGDTITYTFEVENTGNVTLADVTITDILTGLVWVTGPNVGDLAPGATATGEATYLVTAGDLAAGGVTNSATIDCAVACLPEAVPPSSVTVPTAAPALTIAKTAEPADGVVVEDEITYTFTVENTGNVPLDDVTITDDLPGLTWVTGPNVGDLEPGDIVTGEATYVVTQADVDAGSLANSASVDCAVACLDEPPTGGVTIEIDQDPALTFAKSADPTGGVVAGDIITYTFAVENTGNVTLEDVTVTDTLAGLTWLTGPNLGTLAPGDAATGEATYLVTQADVDAGSIANSAVADCAVSCLSEPPGDEITVPADQVPGLAFDKTAGSLDPVDAGHVISYAFRVENTGTVTLEDVTITDTLSGLAWVTGPNVGTLAPGDVVTGEATYTVTAEDVANGGVTNTATVDCAVECVEDPPTSSVTVPGAVRGLELEKRASTSGPVVAGEELTYTFTATNTGNVPLENVTITDTLAGLTWITGPSIGTIGVGESATGEATYVVTAEDVASGGVTNLASADCEVSCLETPPTSEVTVSGADPGLEIVKEADTAGPVNAGDAITYTFTVTNTGNVPLADVTITDSLAGLEWVTGPNVGSLEPGASTTGSATYVVTESDLLNGGVTNSATATGTSPDGSGEPPVSPPSEITVPGGDVPAPGALVVDKSADAVGEVHPGDLITFTFVVTNTGGTAVENVTVVDELPGLGPVEGPHGVTLGAGESATFTATYPVTESDAIAGEIVNTATVSGTGVDGSTVTGEDTVNLEACDPVASDTPTETPGPGTPEADADAESQFGAAATCTGIVEPNPDPTEPPSDPDPTNPPSNGGGNNGGGNNGGGNSGGGGGPVTQLPSTGQSGQADAAVLGSPLLVALLITLVALFGVALRLQIRRDRD